MGKIHAERGDIKINDRKKKKIRGAK